MIKRLEISGWRFSTRSNFAAKKTDTRFELIETCIGFSAVCRAIADGHTTGFSPKLLPQFNFAGMGASLKLDECSAHSRS